MKEVKVSVHCLCYDHERYIAEALDSFLCQKTDFEFEIIVHDDASKDRSPEIIRAYEEKYPGKIKAIYQTENQYQKGIDIFRTYMLPLSSGKYIAICDGDDCWCSEDKLQLQYDHLESHPDTILVACNSERISTDGKALGKVVHCSESRYLSPEELINKGVTVPQTSSFMFRKTYYDVTFPDWFYLTAVDNRIRLSAITLGKMYYINRVMAKYRMMTEGSYSIQMRKEPEKCIKAEENAIAFLNKYNAYTAFRYQDAITAEIEKREIGLALLNGEYGKAHDIAKRSRTYLPPKTRCRIWLGYYFPWILRLKKALRV